jgi:hypothetical protein
MPMIAANPSVNGVGAGVAGTNTNESGVMQQPSHFLKHREILLFNEDVADVTVARPVLVGGTGMLATAVTLNATDKVVSTPTVANGFVVASVVVVVEGEDETALFGVGSVTGVVTGVGALVTGIVGARVVVVVVVIVGGVVVVEVGHDVKPTPPTHVP